MLEFKIIDTIFFHNKKFRILLSTEKNLIYMLEETNDGHLQYPLLEDYVAYLKFQKSTSFPVLLDYEEKDVIDNNQKQIKLVPKVVRKGILIPLMSALIMSGCTETVKSSSAEVVEQTSTIYTAEFEQDCHNLGYEIDYTSFETPYVRETYVAEYNGDTIFCKDIDEFKKMSGLTENYTYQDIKNIFKNNSSIPDEYKEVLYSGLDNMQQELPDLDLTVMYYNAQEIKFIEVNEEEMGSETIPARFNMISKEVLYNPKLLKGSEFIIDHEVLGHGSTECIIPNEDKNIYFGFYVSVIDYIPEYYAISKNCLGRSYSEGSANMIARVASHSDHKSNYNYAEEQLRIIQESCGLSLEELLNNRGVKLLEIMYNNDIDNPVGLLLESDTVLNNYKLKDYQEIKENKQVSSVIENLIIDASEEKVDNGTELTEIQKMMDDTTFENGIRMFDPKTDDTIDSYDADESYEKVEEELKSK